VKKNVLFIVVILMLNGCKKNNPQKLIQPRTFNMGFTTNNLPYIESEEEGLIQSYDTIQKYGDIYLQEIESPIPWNVLVNNTNMPDYITDDVEHRISKQNGDKIVLALNLLNKSKTNLQTDFSGDIPFTSKISDPIIEDACYEYVKYLVYKFNPTYLVLSQGSNELLLNNKSIWDDYKALLLGLNYRLKNQFPELKISQSISLHYWENPYVTDVAAHHAEILGFINKFDFAAIEYYPVFNDQHKRNDFQKSFDFLSKNINIPIAITKTAHIAENLGGSEISDSESDEKEQNTYLKSLLVNAHNNKYEFVIWDVQQDYDQIWDSLPDWEKSNAKIYKDMGLKDESGTYRKAFKTWTETFEN